jgi:hypothetical protein
MQFMRSGQLRYRPSPSAGETAGVSWGARATVLGGPRLSRLTDQPPTTGALKPVSNNGTCARREYA